MACAKEEFLFFIICLLKEHLTPDSLSILKFQHTIACSLIVTQPSLIEPMGPLYPLLAAVGTGSHRNSTEPPFSIQFKGYFVIIFVM